MRWAWGIPAILLVGLVAWGGESELGLGSRALARGGSCVAWADEATAGVCNPAGPVMLEGFHLLAGLAPPMELWLLATAVRWGPLALAGSLAVDISGGESLRAGSLALQMGELFALGVGMRRWERSSTGTETALDLGALYRAGEALLLGVNFGGLVRSGGTLSEPRTRLGAQFGLGWLSGAAELLLSPAAPPQGRAGMELLLFAPLILRLGWNAGHLCGGLGLDSEVLRADFALLAAEEGPVWLLSTEVILRG